MTRPGIIARAAISAARLDGPATTDPAAEAKIEAARRAGLAYSPAAHVAALAALIRGQAKEAP